MGIFDLIWIDNSNEKFALQTFLFVEPFPKFTFSFSCCFLMFCLTLVSKLLKPGNSVINTLLILMARLIWISVLTSAGQPSLAHNNSSSQFKHGHSRVFSRAKYWNLCMCLASLIIKTELRHFISTQYLGISSPRIVGLHNFIMQPSILP